jgi:PIN domain nuclease of toxin-antitoxin system
VDVGVGQGGPAVRCTAEARLILLDTHALLWLHGAHPRSRPLNRCAGHLYVSPVSLLELQLLIEVGRLRLKPRSGVTDLAKDERWLLDDPPAAPWFERALAASWTRDPFDRLLVAHAQLRGWRIATGDAVILKHSSGRCVEL